MNQLAQRAARNLAIMNSRKMTPGEEKQVLAKARQINYQKNPLEWALDKLGVRPEFFDWGSIPAYAQHQWDGTENPLIAISDAIVAKRWVAVEGATSTGKTVWLAILVLWFFDCFENSIVVTSAPKEGQLSLNIWKWIPVFFARLPQGSGVIDTLRIRRFEGRDDWQIIGYGAGVTTREKQGSATKFQSIHAPNLMFLIEETPGFPQEALTAYENSATAPNNIIVAVGNPNSVNDTLHLFSQRKPPRGMSHIRISGFDHPNVVLNDPYFIEGAQTRDGLAQLLEKYKRTSHPLYMSRAQGISPAQAAGSLIQYQWCVEAAARPVEEAKKGEKAIGADVANSEEGDEAAIAEGDGSALVDLNSFACPNSNEFGAKVVTIAKAKGIQAKYTGVDGIGVGAGAINEARRLGFNLVDIQSAAKPQEWVKDRGVQMNERFNNLRSQMWWMMKVDLEDQVESKIVLPYDEELFVDLCTPTWSLNKAGQICIESKDEIKKRLGRSPNKGDACVYWNWVRSRRGHREAKLLFASRLNEEE
jgi:phage terminase large subunit